MPKGDVTITLTVAPDDAARAEAALREAEFAIDSIRGGTIEIRKASGSDNPDGEQQQPVLQTAFEALEARSIPHTCVSSGVVIGGGTPEHAWVEVLLDGKPTDRRVIAANDHEADAQLDGVAEELGVERDRLNIHPPPGWGGYP